MSKEIKKILDIARKEIGVKESPAGSNKQKYGVWYGMNGQPWCAMFTSWVYEKAGHPLPKIQTGAPSGAAYCPYIETFAKKKGRWFKTPRPGDLVLFGFGKNQSVHIGIVEQILSKTTIRTIEGNTGVYNNANGGEVMRRTRPLNSHIRGFYRPLLSLKPEDSYYRLIHLKSPLMYGDDIRAWQKQVNYFGYGLEVDGYYGKLSEQACKDFQATRKIEVDGIVGEVTWTETFKKLDKPKPSEEIKPIKDKIDKKEKPPVIVIEDKKEVDLLKGFALDFAKEYVLPALVNLLDEWAKETETPIDDKIVEFIKEHKDSLLEKLLLML